MEATEPITPIEPSGPRASVVLSWVLIALSVLGIVSVDYYSRQIQETDDTAALVILTLQANVLAAASAFSPEDAGNQLAQFDSLAATPALSRALASLNAWVGGEDGVAHALELLDRQEDALADDDDRALHEAVRRVLDDPETLTGDDEQRILGGMKWFGKLLLASSRPAEDPLRKEVFRDGLFVLAAMMGLLGAAGFGTLAGGVLLIVAMIQISSGRLTFRFGTSTADESIYLQAFAIYLGVICLVGIGLPLIGLAHPALGFVGIVGGSILGVIWPMLRGVPAGTAARDLGLTRGEGFLKEIGAGLVGYLTILPIVAIGFLVTLALITLVQAIGTDASESPEVVSHPVAVWMAHGGLGIRLAVLFLAAGFAPFFEETLFRGALQRGVRRKLGPVVSGLIVAFIFAVIHPQGLLLVPALGALGFGFALLREWRGSLVAPMVAHAVHNGTLVMFMWITF
jgi:membrane protease YdiL (CAAX protease family)